MLTPVAHMQQSGTDTARDSLHLPHPRAYMPGPAGLSFPEKPARARVFFSPTSLWYERIFHAGAGDAIKQFWKETLRHL
jgi:hypothetical protein